MAMLPLHAAIKPIAPGARVRTKTETCAHRPQVVGSCGAGRHLRRSDFLRMLTRGDPTGPRFAGLGTTMWFDEDRDVRADRHWTLGVHYLRGGPHGDPDTRLAAFHMLTAVDDSHVPVSRLDERFAINALRSELEPANARVLEAILRRARDPAHAVRRRLRRTRRLCNIGDAGCRVRDELDGVGQVITTFTEAVEFNMDTATALYEVLLSEVEHLLCEFERQQTHQMRRITQLRETIAQRRTVHSLTTRSPAMASVATGLASVSDGLCAYWTDVISFVGLRVANGPTELRYAVLETLARGLGQLATRRHELHRIYARLAGTTSN